MFGTFCKLKSKSKSWPNHVLHVVYLEPNDRPFFLWGQHRHHFMGQILQHMGLHLGSRYMTS